jgi:hypothetical protein
VPDVPDGVRGEGRARGGAVSCLRPHGALASSSSADGIDVFKFTFYGSECVCVQQWCSLRKTIINHHHHHHHQLLGAS